jgi:hypothetical protein
MSVDYVPSFPLNNNLSTVPNNLSLSTKSCDPIVKQQSSDNSKSRVKRDECGIVWSIYGLLLCCR